METYARNGIGYCLIHGDTIVSWCSTDFARPGACDLYVETFGAYKRQGFGALVSHACIKTCLGRELAVHWHCWEDNVASVRLAGRIGLVKAAEHSVLTLILSEDWPGAAESETEH
jgi:RimJ/RimL family protein N-acetyltransferase